MGSWSDLPDDLLRLISQLLISYDDFVRFASVCLSWRSIALEGRHCLPHKLPMLMFPFDESSKTCNLLSIAEKKAFKLYLPELSNRWCCGSSMGWLVTVDDQLNIHLVNPLSRAQVHLPSHPLFPDILVRSERCFDSWKQNFILKVALSASPPSSNCIVMAIISDFEELSFCRLGEDKWTTLKDPHIHFEDIIWFRSKIYGALYLKSAVVCDACTDQLNIKELNLPEIRPKDWSTHLVTRRYLVESSGRLLHIIRYLDAVEKCDEGYWGHTEDEDDFCYKTSGFDVFKLKRNVNNKLKHKEKNKRPWTKVKSLGGQSILLGASHSFSFNIGDIPNWRANCIYFLDDYNDGQCHDMGVYVLEGKKIETFYPDAQIESFYPDVLALYARAFWITTNL